MKNVIVCLLVSAAMLHAAAAAAAGPATSVDPVVTSLQARLEVGPDGRVIEAALPPGTAPIVADAVRAYVAGWRFQPPMRDGVAVGGTTFLRIGACALPDGAGGVALSLHGGENGPGYAADMLSGRHLLAVVPASLAMSAKRIDLAIQYRVEPDGTAVVESIDTTGARGTDVRRLEASIRKSLEGLTFEPERIDGVPVTTRMRMPIWFTFHTDREARRMPSEREQLLARPACQALLDDSGRQRPVALDSPFRAPPAG